MSKGLLYKINSPKDLKKLREDQLEGLCFELREFIIEAVSNNPAHFHYHPSMVL